MQRLALLALAATALFGCTAQGTQPAAAAPTSAPAMSMHHSAWDTVHSAIAALIPKSGSNVHGFVRFDDVPMGVRVSGEVTGLDPNSTHAMHIHMYGDASDEKGDSAGPHYNPEHKHHGGPDAPEHHAGDLGNITADATGKATFSYTVANISVAGLKNPIIGRGVVIHAGVDDLKTDPTGNAGGRIAVGAIGVTPTFYSVIPPATPSSPPAP